MMHDARKTKLKGIPPKNYISNKTTSFTDDVLVNFWTYIGELFPVLICFHILKSSGDRWKQTGSLIAREAAQMQMMQMREELEMLKEAPSKAQKDDVPWSVKQDFNRSSGNSVCVFIHGLHWCIYDNHGLCTNWNIFYAICYRECRV